MVDLLIAGDFCPNDRVARLIEQEEYSDILGEIKPIIAQMDYSLINLECPIVEYPIKPKEKQGPNLKASQLAIKLIKYANFKCVTLANNHFLDYGDEGVSNTLNVLRYEHLDFVGGGENLLRASSILYKDINGKKLAFINCCEHEFSIATEHSAGANPLNPIQQYYEIVEAKNKADYVIIVVHGGHEYFQLPSPRMQEIYRFFVDIGADAVINHHQHCYSGYEVYKEKPIFYGLGNFCFDKNTQRNSIWNEGYLVKLVLDDKIHFKLYPYIQCNDTPNVVLMKKEHIDNFYSSISYLNEVIADSCRLKLEHKHWMKEREDNLKLVLSPYSNRWFRIMASRGLLPMFLSKKRKLSLFNFIYCESHRDRIIYLLNDGERNE